MQKLTLKIQLLQHIRNCYKVAQNFYLNKARFLFNSCQMKKERAFIPQIIQIYQKYTKFDLRNIFLFLQLSFLIIQNKTLKINRAIKRKIFHLPKERHQLYIICFKASVSQKKRQETYHQSKIQPSPFIITPLRKTKLPNVVSYKFSKARENQKEDTLFTKISQLLKNKEQFLNIISDQQTLLKSKITENIPVGIGKTVKIKSYREYLTLSKRHGHQSFKKSSTVDLAFKNNFYSSLVYLYF